MTQSTVNEADFLYLKEQLEVAEMALACLRSRIITSAHTPEAMAELKTYASKLNYPDGSTLKS